MIAAVFGGNGFIGSHLVGRLLALGHSVRVFDRPAPKRQLAAGQERLQFFGGDFSTEPDFRQVLKGCDVVFHLISTTLPNSSNDDPAADVMGNLIPTLRLLEQMRETGVRKIVFPSSGGTVYGEASRLPIDEQHPTNPIVSYGAVKLAIEKYLAIYRRSFSLLPVCLRISNPYGPGFRPSSPQGAVGAFLHKTMNGQAIELWGTGEIRRDYLYIDDLIDAFVLSIGYEGEPFIFNISTGIGTSLLEIIEHIRSATGRDILVQENPSRSFDVQVNILSNALAGEKLGWHPATTLQKGISLTADWLNKQNQKPT